MSDRWDVLVADERHRRSGDWDDHLIDMYLHDAALSQPDALAVIDGPNRLKYRELDALVDRFSLALRSLGVEWGTVVSWQLPNWWEALVTHHAITRVGAVSNPLMPILRERELSFMLAQAKSRVLLVPETFRGFGFGEMADSLAAELPDLKHVIFVRPERDDERSFASVLADSGTLRGGPDTRTADDPVLLLYTSGTESDPKGAIHSHNTLGYDNRSIIKLFNLTADDVVFMPSPVAHITGVLYGLHLPAMLGTTVVLQDIWEPAHALRLISRERCSLMVAATPFLHMLVHHDELPLHDVSSLRVFACGGADVSPALVRTATKNLNTSVVRIYGSTEFPTLCSGTEFDSLEKRAETDGRVIGAAEAKILREDASAAAAGESGDLRVRGPECFLGYLDPSLTEKAFDAEGWFRTGDLATRDPDGYIVINGRRKDVIVRGGENISAKEVEDLLIEHDSIREAAIVAMPDPIMVERACAFVVPEPGAEITLAEIGEFLIAKKIARQKMPERLELVGELPKTPSGKVKKFELRTRVASIMAAEATGHP